ncbi:MAG TPA: phosphatidate cytidylyltransferase [Verrucomicrobiae bacterium]|nr:phosphatidate cytidylyltransferase [Verrucomicrobiae bacterium]
MLLRLATAAVLIPLVVLLVWYAPPMALAGVAAGVACLALVEFFQLGDRMGLRGFRKWTVGCTFLLFYAQYSMWLDVTHTFGSDLVFVRRVEGPYVSLEAILLIFIFVSVAIGLGTRRPLPEVMPAIAVSSAGILFIALPFSYLVRLDEVERVGRQLVLFTLCLVWAGDMLAYFVGRFLGRLRMAPALSPKKTWEGAVGNVIGSLLVAMAFSRSLGVEPVTLLAIAAAANIAGQAGDLIESAYKRGAVVKDSGSLLPGHGGMLDRIDSLILAAPVVWALYELALRGN